MSIPATVVVMKVSRKSVECFTQSRVADWLFAAGSERLEGRNGGIVRMILTSLVLKKFEQSLLRSKARVWN